MTPHASADVEVEGKTDGTAAVVVAATSGPILSKREERGEACSVWTVDDVFAHRQRSTPLPRGTAAFASADMFKSPGCFKKPKAKRWDHRINLESRSRQSSSLKGAMKYFQPEMISLCGGLPSSEYFPFEQIDVKLPVPPQFSEAHTLLSGQVFSARKHDVQENKALYDLSIALNYGQSMGPAQLLRFITEHTELVHRPPYADWDVCMTCGNTAALEISLRMFVERGHYVLTEEYSFSSAIETMTPLGARMIGVKVDAHGMRPDDLDHILSTWDETARRAPKPFLMYTVPTGQNPTASTQPVERRRQIYAVAEKHDLFIIEDEPYYFLQMDPYVSGQIHAGSAALKPIPIAEFLSHLTPSYLSLDTSGRVLRLDSFSKIIAPGSRCGWVTGSAQVIERFLRHTEVSTQTPSGFSIMALYKLLEEAWGHRGFLEWLMFIRAEYTKRRDVIVHACERYLPTEVASWTPPMAGMFHWIKVDVTKHPGYVKEEMNYAKLLEIEEAIFLAGVEQSVLLARGSWFRAQRGTDTELFFRTTFAAASPDKIDEAVSRFGDGLRKEFGLEDTKQEQIKHTNGAVRNEMPTQSNLGMSPRK